MDSVKRKYVFEHAQNGRIRIILHMRNVSSGHFLSIEHSMISDDFVSGQ